MIGVELQARVGDLLLIVMEASGAMACMRGKSLHRAKSSIRPITVGTSSDDSARMSMPNEQRSGMMLKAVPLLMTVTEMVECGIS